MTQTLPGLCIGQHRVRYPIVQGAMAVGVSGGRLAGAVAQAGGVGMIASLGLGLRLLQRDRLRGGSFFRANRTAVIEELTKARHLSPTGVIGVNVLVATKNYAALAQTAAAHGANVIIAGAGLPLDLPEHTRDYPDVALVPSVANLSAVQMICQTWQQRYRRLPDALIIENCRSVGGHFNQCEQLFPGVAAVENLLRQVREYLSQQLEVEIPLIISGGVQNRADLQQMLAIGASGVQIGTRFITTEECDADRRYKEFHLQADPDDVVVVPSPVGKPGRALRNQFSELALANSPDLERTCIANCLTSCLCRDQRTTYCILQALANAAQGDIDRGLIFSGANVGHAQKIVSVAELMTELTQMPTAIDQAIA